MRIFDRIKFDGVGNNESWLAYKPKIENIVLGSQLIVGMGQEAIFIKGGRAQDIFTAGTYTLQTGNLPLLGNIVGRAFGGNTPFTAEIVFVNITNNLSLKWGTTSTINKEDPRYGLLLNLRAHGKFSVKVDDTRNFVNQLVGTVPLGSGLNDEMIWNKFSSSIITKFKSQLDKLITDKKISFLDIATYYSELSESTLQELKQSFKDCGLELVNFLVEDVSPPPEQYADLRRRKEEIALGEDVYNRHKVLEIAEKTNNQEMGKIIAQSVFGNRTSNSSTPPPPPSNNSDEISCPHCHRNIKSDSKFCRFCGYELPREKFCSHCGTSLPLDAAFCSHCGRAC